MALENRNGRPRCRSQSMMIFLPATMPNFGFLLYFASVNRQQELLPEEVVHIGFKIS
jgi:hypothetical protein